MKTSPRKGSNKEKNIVVEIENGNSVPVSFQLMQSIYNKITGKKEELSKEIYIPFQLDINDIQQLNSKIEQFKEQYNIVSNNCSITLLYENDTKEVFSSFERFLLINISNTSPVEILILKYNFLISLPKSKTAQNYEIEIRIRSLAQFIVNKVKEDELESIKKITTAYYKVNYIDYIVGQSIMDLIERWFNSLHAEENGVFVKFIRKIKDPDDFIQLVTYITAFIFLYILVLLFTQDKEIVDISFLLKSILIGGFVIMISEYIGIKISNGTAKSINKIYSLSYMKLNKGDEKVIEKFKKIKKGGYIKGIGTLFITITIGVMSSLIAWFLTK